MRALVFENSLPRQVITALLAKLTPRAFTGPLAPIQLREIPEPRLLGPDWIVLKTELCGLCGSDYKQVARYPHQAALAQRFGTERVFAHQPVRQIIEGVAAALQVEINEPWHGLPMLNGGVDIVYDTVTAAATLEVGVRVTRTRGHVVCLGVEIPRRFEWTPLYFKELSLVGSNAFGIEQLEGRRLHAMECYFELLRRHAVDATPIITHRFRLEEYRQAFLACRDQGAAGAVKVLFDYRARPRRPPGTADSDARGETDDDDHLL